MINISPYAYQAWFSVETNHGAKLEFVLDSTDDLQGREHGLGLMHFLQTMLDTEFERDEFSRVVEYSGYGDVSFRVESSTPQDLQQALERCDLVVGAWLERYRTIDLRS